SRYIPSILQTLSNFSAEIRTRGRGSRTDWQSVLLPLFGRPGWVSSHGFACPERFIIAGPTHPGCNAATFCATQGSKRPNPKNDFPLCVARTSDHRAFLRGELARRALFPGRV